MINSPIDVSVIIPVHNILPYVNSCIRIALDQDFENVEFIFIDDYSTDDGFNELVSMIKLEYAHRKVIFIRNEKNLGVSTTRNIGLRNASGQYVYFSDADDMLNKNIISKLYSRAQQSDADIVWCDFYNVYGEEEVYVDQQVDLIRTSCLKALLEGKLTGALWNKLIRRTLFTENNVCFPDGLNMSEDLRVSVELFYYAKKTDYIQEALYRYIKSRISSITNSHVNKSNFINNDRVENVKGIARFIDEKNIRGVDKELNILKLMAKKSLLLTAESLSAFKKWKDIFPEANSTMKESDFPLHYRLLAKAISKQWWWVVKIWIIKRKVQNKIKSTHV